MFLVSPGVYEKLLTCLDEKDKKSTELLNIEKEQEDRPSEKVIERITTGDFEPEDSMYPDNLHETPEVFGEQDQQNIEEGEVRDIQEPPGEREIQIPPNPLRNLCPLPTTSNRVIPQQIYNPNLNTLVPPSTTQQTAAKIVKKYRTLKPTVLSKVKNIGNKNQLISQQLVRVKEEPQGTTDIAIPKPDKKNHQCPVCKKYFGRPWSLARHVSSVHKNLGSVKNILENSNPTIKVEPTEQTTTQTVVAIPQNQLIKKPRRAVNAVTDTDTIMIDNDRPSTSFDSWTKPGKRTTTEAKLPTTPRRALRPTPTAKKHFDNWQ